MPKNKLLTKHSEEATATVSTQAYVESNFVRVIESLKKEKNISLSPESLESAKKGTIDTFLKKNTQWTQEEKHWLQAIQYAYHFNTISLPKDPQKSLDILYTAASYFSLKENFHYLEKFFNHHEKLFTQQSSLERLFAEHKELLKEGTSFSSTQVSCLFYSAYGDFNTVRSLLEELLHKGSTPPEIYTFAFLEASKRGELKLVAFILRDIGDKLSLTHQIHAFHHAHKKKHLPVTKLLLKHPANQRMNKILLYDAARCQNLEMLNFLLAHAGKNMLDDYKIQVLYYAIRNRSPAIAKLLLQHPALRTLKKTALYHGASKGQLDIVNFLLDHAGDTIPAEDKGQALHYSAQNGHFIIVVLLMLHPSGQTIPAAYKNFALQAGVQKGHIAIVHYLLNEVGETFSRSNRGSALCTAVSTKNIALVELLLQHLENDATSLQYYQKALSTARRNHAIDIEALLIAPSTEKRPLEEAEPSHRTKLRRL